MRTAIGGAGPKRKDPRPEGERPPWRVGSVVAGAGQKNIHHPPFYLPPLCHRKGKHRGLLHDHRHVELFRRLTLDECANRFQFG